MAGPYVTLSQTQAGPAELRPLRLCISLPPSPWLCLTCYCYLLKGALSSLLGTISHLHELDSHWWDLAGLDGEIGIRSLIARTQLEMRCFVLMCRYCVRMMHEVTGMLVLSCAECVSACWIAAWMMQVEQTDGRSLRGDSIQFLCRGHCHRVHALWCRAGQWRGASPALVPILALPEYGPLLFRLSTG